MVQNFSIHKGTGLVVFTPTGTMNFMDYVETLTNYHCHPDFRVGQKLFVNLSQIDGFEPDYDKVASRNTIDELRLSGRKNDTKMVLYTPDASILDFVSRLGLTRDQNQYAPRFYTNNIVAGLKFLEIDPSRVDLVNLSH